MKMISKIFPFVIAITIGSFCSGQDSLARQRSDTIPDSTQKAIETMPEFPGGQLALKNFLQNNIDFPREARDNGIDGKVIVSFLVQPDGQIDSIQLKEAQVFIQMKNSRRPASEQEAAVLIKEAFRLMSIMPRWKPGTLNGVAVPVHYNLPITWVLEQ
jgi:Ca-activated chloride channel homolog